MLEDSDFLQQLSERAKRAGCETLASILMSKSLDHPELVSLAAAWRPWAGQ